MWGDILEEDLYDDSQPFYDEDIARRESEYRKNKME